MRFHHQNMAFAWTRDGSSRAVAVLLLHGLSGISSGYDEVVDDLGASADVFRLDLRGHGRSDRAPGTYSVPFYTEDVIAFIEEVITKPVVLIGHSLGTVTIMRYLEALPPAQHMKKAILVAGFTDQLGFKELENFFETRLNFTKIKPKAKDGFVLIQSDDDPFVSAQYGTRLEQELGAKLVVKHGAKHMSGPVDGEEICAELPEVVQNL